MGVRATFVAVMKGLLVPMLPTIPLLGLLIWASLNRGFRPLQALADELRLRSADDISPIESEMLPSEIRPLVASLNNLFGKVGRLCIMSGLSPRSPHTKLHTPLAGLRTQAQIAMAAREERTREMALSQILFAVDRATRLVRQLLAIARLELKIEYFHK